MREYFHVRLGEPGPVNDGRVIECVGDDEVALSHEGRNQAHIGHITGIEDQGGLSSKEMGKLFFEGFVFSQIPVDQA